MVNITGIGGQYRRNIQKSFFHYLNQIVKFIIELECLQELEELQKKNLTLK